MPSPTRSLPRCWPRRRPRHGLGASLLNVPRLAPSEARSSVTVLLIEARHPDVGPVKGHASGAGADLERPQGEAVGSPQLGNRALPPSLFATQMLVPSKATPKGSEPDLVERPQLAPSEARSLVTVLARRSSPPKCRPRQRPRLWGITPTLNVPRIGAVGSPQLGNSSVPLVRRPKYWPRQRPRHGDWSPR